MKIVILAGGGGTRLFPLSRVNFPKQFLNIDSDISLLSQTVNRYIGLVNPEDIVIVTNEKYYFYVKAELAKCGAKKASILSEPSGRNTAPAIALAVKYLRDELLCEDNEIVFVAPSDQIIKPKEEFQNRLKLCEKAASLGKIVTLGVKPEKPETGYGYIKCGSEWKDGFEVEKFTEKPDSQTAERYLQEGNYMWNSGMYCFSIQSFLEELQKYEPEMYEVVNKYSYNALIKKFDALKSISIDYAIAERSSNVITIPLSIYWNDVGSWDSIYDYMNKDDNGNVKIGDCETVDCSNSFIMSNDRLLTCVGLEDTIVVETDDVIMVSKRGETQKVKDVVDKLKGRIEASEHTMCYRPWGTYKVLSQGPGYKVKKITVNPYQSLSIQLHNHRSEHWVVIRGIATVVIGGDDARKIKKNESIYIPKQTKHKLMNMEQEILEIVEVQNGDYVGEDDIVRFEDIYGRD